MTELLALLPDMTTLIKLIGVPLCLIGIAICFAVAAARPSDVPEGRVINLGVTTLPAITFYKLLVLAGIVVIPSVSVAVANYLVFEGSAEVRACNRCHVMRPNVVDMRDARSESLAALHYRNRWIPDLQCYYCHTDYGLPGALAAKMEGFRHLARYTTGTYTEPIAFRGVYDNHNCLKCHQGTRGFDAVPPHHTLQGRLDASTSSCLDCHGAAHPTPEQRTPGSASYHRLMTEAE